MTVNEYYQQKLRAIHKKLPVRVVYPFTQIPRRPPVPTNDLYDIVWVGRFQDLKGILDIPLVIHEINKRGRHVKVAILGGGEEHIRRELLSLASKMGVTDQINLLGFITGEAKEKIIASSRTFLSTSYYESFGLAIIEALSLGLPVVAYNLPTFQVFNNALTVAPIGDYTEIASALYDLLTSQERYQKKLIDSHEALELLAPHNVNQQLLELLRL